MKLFITILFLELILTNTLVYSEQRVLIWDYDGTIVDQNTDTTVTEKPLLPHVETVMKEGEPLNIVCSGIRSLRPTTHTSQKKTAYNPHKDIEKFKHLMDRLPITAVVFSYAPGGTECWVLIKTDTGIEVRTAHEDARYCHLKGCFQKPDTGMLHVIKDLLRQWDIQTDTLLFIGDTLQDQQAAQAFGIPFEYAVTVHKTKEAPLQMPL